MQLAWDGSTNLYVSDPYNRRVLVFSPGIGEIFPDGVRNAASLAVHAVGSIVFGGTITAGEVVDVTIDSHGIQVHRSDERHTDHHRRTASCR